jgi:hypothetical protein
VWEMPSTRKNQYPYKTSHVGQGYKLCLRDWPPHAFTRFLLQITDIKNFGIYANTLVGSCSSEVTDMNEPLNAGSNERRCPCCGGAEFVEGTIAGLMPVSFRPNGIRKYAPGIPLKAFQCRECGNVQFFAKVKTVQRAAQ